MQLTQKENESPCFLLSTVPFWCSDTKDTLYLIYGDRANYFQDLLCIYVLTLLESEINTIIKDPFSIYIIMPQIKYFLLPHIP